MVDADSRDVDSRDADGTTRNAEVSDRSAIGTTPVTVLSGALGAGKTTTMNHLLSADHGREVAVLVNDVGEMNVDAELVERRVEGDREVVELSNGCICCGMGGEFESALIDLAFEESFDHLLVEPSGVSEPAPVVRPFLRGHASGFYTVESVATVVDAAVVADAFGTDSDRVRDAVGRATTDLNAVRATSKSVATGTGRGTDEPRPLTDLVVEGVEFCDTVIVNKTDLVDDEELDAAVATIRTLRPGARILETTFGRVDPDELFDAGRFELDTVANAAGWKRALGRHSADERADGHEDSGGNDHEHADGHDHEHADGHDHVHPPEEYGVDSLVYERRRPFHPERLAALFADPPSELVRAKGWVHVAGRPDHALTLSLAGREVHVDVAGRWIASMDAPLRDRYREARDPDWVEGYGDRKTELVVIGRDLNALAAEDRRGIEAVLDDCLCVDAELAADGLTPDPEPTENRFPARDGRRVRL